MPQARMPQNEPALEGSAHENSWSHWLKGRLSAWRARQRLRDELQALGPDETDLILRDCGLTRSDLPTVIERYPDSCDLLPRMMSALGIDRESLRHAEPETLRELELTCLSCPDWRHCKSELAHGTAARDYARFCPNATLLQDLRHESHPDVHARRTA